ncbi:MAG TPA: alpha/beta fold hydrolase [Gemmataceae bacterium]|nr:alpha/beta fold hydrolase [Gemmataceae bacterium]
MYTMTLRASQTAIAFEDAGAGPVVALLHAFPLDSGMWGPQIGELATRYRVIAPDLPGFGGSAVSAGLTMDSIADVLAELLDHLGVNERIALAGVSMGGYAALAFARLYPQRLRALILADTKADADDEPGRANRDRLIQLATDRGPAAVLDQLLPKLLGPHTIAARPATVQRVRALAGRQSTDGIVAALKALRDRPDAAPGLAHIAVPTLVVVGDQDAVTPPEKAMAMAAAIPNSQLVTVPDAGHLSNLENPDLFTAAVREFLDRLPEEGSPSRMG